MSDNWEAHDDSGDLLSGGGSAPAFKFENIDDKVSGTVLRVKKSIDTKPDGTTSTWPNGDPKHVYIFTLDTDEGERSVFCRGNMVKAVKEAAAAAGVATLVGQKLTIQHHALGDKQPGKFPAKLFRAKVEAGVARKPAETNTTDSW